MRCGFKKSGPLEVYQNLSGADTMVDPTSYCLPTACPSQSSRSLWKGGRYVANRSIRTACDIWGDRDQCCQKEWTRHQGLQSRQKNWHETEDQDLKQSPYPNQAQSMPAGYLISSLQLATLGAVWLGLSLLPPLYPSFNSIH